MGGVWVGQVCPPSRYWCVGALNAPAVNKSGQICRFMSPYYRTLVAAPSRLGVETFFLHFSFKVHIHRFAGEWTLAIQRPSWRRPPLHGPVREPLNVLEEVICLRYACPAEGY